MIHMKPPPHAGIRYGNQKPKEGEAVEVIASDVEALELEGWVTVGAEAEELAAIPPLTTIDDEEP